MRNRQAGLSLVEVMVAVLIGLIGILIITQAYITGDRFNRSTLGEGGAQTNGLIALYSVERDVRLSGYGIANSGALGCGEIHWYYDPAYSGSMGGTLPDIELAPVLITVTAGEPDQITVMYGTEAERMMPSSITNFVPSSSEVTVDGTAGFQVNDLILLVNAAGCTLGKITQVQPGPQKLQLNPGASAPYNPPAWGSFPTAYGSGDMIMNLGNPIVRSYSIFNRKLRVTDGLLQSGASTPRDLVDGILDMRAEYGKDTDNDGVVDAWNNVKPVNSAEWTGVLALRMAVLARIGNFERPSVSGGDCDATTAANAPTWSGATQFTKIDVVTVTSEDRCYRYRVFETTIPLRNMIWRSS
jgi:type IV pilus assembly protein PilW